MLCVEGFDGGSKGRNVTKTTKIYRSHTEQTIEMAYTQHIRCAEQDSSRFLLFYFHSNILQGGKYYK